MSQNVSTETLKSALDCLNDYIEEGWEYPDAEFRAYSEFCGEGITAEMLRNAYDMGV